jgi:FKBP-type peptidyl-prolyl cis-trans isomerase
MKADRRPVRASALFFAVFFDPFFRRPCRGSDPGMQYSYWGSAVKPQATPSETCLPHQLHITKAVLDPVQAEKLPPGTRISVWATQKIRPHGHGVLQPVESNRSLVAVLVTSQRESVDTSLYFRNATLLSLSISPQSHSCSVHLSGYFDKRSEKLPEEIDDGSISWAELQSLLANARGQPSDGSEDDDGSSAIEEMRRLIDQAQTAPDQEVSLGKRKLKKLQKVRDAAEVNEQNFTEWTEEKKKIADSGKVREAEERRKEHISKFGKARKLAGGTQVCSISAGAGKLIKVGSRVTLTLAEQSPTGKRIGESSTITFVVGLKSVPSGLDRAVVGMRAGSRALIMLEAAGNDRPLATWPASKPLTLEVLVDSVT